MRVFVKKIMICFLSINMVWQNVSYAVSAREDGICFYVDINASQNGSGSKDSPFNTINSAKEAVREIIKSEEYPNGGITVYLRGGKYFSEDTLVFDKYDSGSNEAPVKWCAYNNEEVTITMGESISFKGFLPVENNPKINSELNGKIYSFNLAENGYDMYDMLYMGGHSQIYFYNFGMAEEGTVEKGIPIPWVFMNDTVGNLARYPNDGEYMKTGEKISGGNLDDGKWYTSDYVGGKIEGEIKGFKMKVTDERIKNWGEAKDARMWGVWCHDWSDFDVGIKEIDVENQTIESTHPSPYPLKEGKRWYIYNLLEELDSPGEWFLDKSDGEFYVMPPENFGEDDEITLAFNKKNIITIESEAKNIEFSGITFSGTRLNGIRLNNPNNITITDSTFEKICSKAIKGYGTDIKILNCEFKNLGQGAVELLNLGYAENLPASGNEIKNNKIYNFGLLGGSYALEIGGSGAVIKNNEIHDSKLGAVGLSGNDHLIENNEMYNLLEGKDDFGVISCVNSMIMRGTVIRNNIIHDIYSSVNGAEGVHGIYIDNYQSGYTITDNLIYNIGGFGVFINMGRDNTVTDNVFINLKRGVHVSSGYQTEKPTDRSAYGITETLVNNPAYQKYPHMDTLLLDDWWKTRYNVIKNNYNYNVDIAFYLLPKNISKEDAEYGNIFESGASYSNRKRYLQWSEFPYFPQDAELSIKKDGETVNILSGEKMTTGGYDISFNIKGKEFKLFYDVVKSCDAVVYEDFESYEIGETPSFISSTGNTISAEVADDGTGNKVLKITYKNEPKGQQKYNYLTLKLDKDYSFGKYSYDYKVKIVNTANGCFSPFMAMCNTNGGEIMTRQSIASGFVYDGGYVVPREKTAMENGYYISHSIVDLDNKKQYVPDGGTGLLEKNLQGSYMNFSSIKIRGILDTPLGITAPEGSEYAIEDTEIYFIDDLEIKPIEFAENGIYKNGEKIEDISNAAGENVTVRAAMGDISDQSPEMIVIFAVYKDNRLIDIKIVKREELNAANAEAEFNIPQDTDKLKIEYMVFNNLTELKPLSGKKAILSVQ